MKPPEKAYLIDTNVVLRFLLGDHPKFSPKAEAFMRDLDRGVKKVEFLDIVLVECVYVMEKFYRIPRDEITDKLTKIMNFSGIINSNRSELIQALLAFETSNVDIVDCILASYSSASKIVVSFDKDMRKLEAIRESL